FRPAQPLSAFNGKRIAGTWTLQVIDDTAGVPGTLVSWSLVVTPSALQVTANPPGTPANLAARTFRISFPAQDIGGTYPPTLGPDIRSALGDAMDTNFNAGVDLLYQNPTAGTTPVFTAASGLPQTIPLGGTLTSNLTVADNFLIQGVTLQLNITY